MSEANNIISLPSESKTQYNTLHLAGKEMCKTDEIFLVRFDFDMKLLYGRHPEWVLRSLSRVDKKDANLFKVLFAFICFSFCYTFFPKIRLGDI